MSHVLTVHLPVPSLPDIDILGSCLGVRDNRVDPPGWREPRYFGPCFRVPGFQATSSWSFFSCVSDWNIDLQ